MNRIVGLKQFEITRGALLKFMENLDDKTADTQPEGFNNTIRWHIGHVLSAAELFMFGREFKHLPSEYPGLFGYGTRPSKWETEGPSLEVLKPQLQEQAKRISAIPAEAFENKLPERFLGLETVGELYGMMLYHEADHIGQMKAMERIIKAL
ncbi:DinB family protein [Bacillus paramycoides]|uniref:Formate dehydrogenase n=1 Tax=Bacillus paramycoides TaxID=2026194 RepID=A0A1J9URU2_9BACI|nr:DinB family protein [Bacillus paramycoides]OJD81528.1 formate dehydrogenase [Bacillus paramycoides]